MEFKYLQKRQQLLLLIDLSVYSHVEN